MTGWSRSHKRLTLLVFACWEICVLMPHKIHLCCMWVTCHLLDMPDGHPWTLHLFYKLPSLVCWKLVQVYVAVIYLLADKFFIFKEELENVPVKYLGCFCGVLSQSNLGFNSLYHSLTDLFPCQKLIRRSNLALTSFKCGLQNSSNFSQIVSGISSSVDKLQETYWSMPKSPLQAIIFLHFLVSDNIAS